MDKDLGSDGVHPIDGEGSVSRLHRRFQWPRQCSGDPMEGGCSLFYCHVFPAKDDVQTHGLHVKTIHYGHIRNHQKVLM